MRIYELFESSPALYDAKFIPIWEQAIKTIIEAKLTDKQGAQLFETIDRFNGTLVEHPIYGQSPLERRLAQQKAAAAAGQQQAPAQQQQAPAQQQQAPAQQQQAPAAQQGSKIGNAIGAVKHVYDSIKGAIQNSRPVQAFDQKADQLLDKLKNTVGGDGGSVMQAVTKYRDFAKQHPIMQGVVYAALIGLSGISGAGLGGAVLLGAVKMIDKLLQGNKASSALWSGFVTGGAAYGASQIASHLGGGGGGAQASDAASNVSSVVRPADIAKQTKDLVVDAMQTGDITDYNSYQEFISNTIAQVGGQASDQSRQLAARMADTMMKQMAAQAAGGQLQGSGPQVVNAMIQAAKAAQ